MCMVFTFLLTIPLISLPLYKVDVERDAEMASNGSAELSADFFAAASSNPAIKDNDEDTREVKELKKKRRSTIIETIIDFKTIDFEADE